MATLTGFEILLLVTATTGTLAAVGGFVFSIAVWFLYKSEKKKVDRIHRRMNTSMKAGEQVQMQLVEIMENLFKVLKISDPAVMQNSLAALEGMREQLQSLPKDVFNMTRSMAANQTKAYNAKEREVKEKIDEFLSEEALAAYADVPDNQLVKLLIPMLVETEPFDKMALKYAMGRVQAHRDGRTNVTVAGKKAGSVHPLDLGR